MSSRRTAGPRTLVIGIDALCADVLSGLSPGTAPTIKSILESGSSGPLESQLPPWTPSAWPSIYTGVNPGKHGVYGFLRFQGYEWDVVNATDVREQTFWELCSEQGLTSVVVNAPVTHPPKEFQGALIPGYTAPEDPDCYPPGLLEEVRAEIGSYRVYDEDLRDGVSMEERIEGYVELTEMRGAALRYLIEREDPDLAFVQFQQSDTVFHELPETDAPDRVYAAIDAEIKQTLEAYDPETVIIVSDHGIGPCDGYEVRPNVLLRDQGYLETTTDGEKPSWSAIANRRLKQGHASDDETVEDGPSLASRALATAASVGLTSQRIGAILERLRLDGVAIRFVSPDLVAAAEETVDFPNSAAYLRDRIELGIRFNLAGREPSGRVNQHFDELREDLIEEFRKLTTPEGDPVFDAVLPKEEVFHGPYVSEAPDILLVPASFDHTLSAAIRDDLFGEPREAWTHKLHGMIAISSETVQGDELEGAHLFDVAPTILATLGVPVSDRMDGEVLPVVDPPGVESYPPYRGETVATNDHDVEARLSDLGYLE